MSSSDSISPGSDSDEKKKEGKQMGYLGCTSYVVGNVIGSGIFITPVTILKYTNSVGLSLLVWIGCGLISLIGGICYIELGTSIREPGCDFAYTHYVGWEALTFAFMWVGALICHPAAGAVQALTIGEYLVTGIRPLLAIAHPWDTIITKGIAVFCMVSLALLNFFPIGKYASKLQIGMAAAKFLVVGVIISTGLYCLIILGQSGNLQNLFTGSVYAPGKVALAFYGGLWSYGGWDILNYGTPEIYKPRRTMPLAIITGLLAVCTVYVLMNLSYFVVLSTEDMLNSTAVAADFSHKKLGNFSYAIPFLISILLIGSLNSVIFFASRVIHAAARRGHLPPFLSAVNKKTGSPRAALVAQMCCGILASFVNVRTLINYVMFVNWGHRAASAAALLYIRYTKMQVAEDAIRVPVVFPVLFLFICCALVSVPFVEETIMTCIGAACVFSGLIVYFVLVRPTTSISFIKSINDFLSGITCRILNCELDVVKKNDEESDESESINSATEKSQEDNKNV